MVEVTMPKLSDSMEEGIILTWLVEHGAEVEEGEELLEIETDKATMTHPAEASGVLEVVVQEGETVPVGELIARIGEAGTTTAAGTAAAEPDAPSPEREAEVVQADQPAPGSGGDDAGGGGARPRATPLARRIAADHDVMLDSLDGSGPGGRVVKRDVLAAAGIEETPKAAPETNGQPPKPTAPATTAKGAETVQSLSRLQQTIAKRMAEAKATVPHLQVQVDVEMGEAIEFRRKLKERSTGATVPSINDLIIKASALALREHPRANGSYRDGEFVLHERVNVGFAVASEDALVVPTVVDADTKSLGEIARNTQALAARVRDGEVTPPELAGGTFTVSNLGMFGMTAITPVVNPPQAAILGVGAARPVLARRSDGEIDEREMATMTLSCDHRILYGADAARFLTSIKELIESPLLLVL